MAGKQSWKGEAAYRLKQLRDGAKREMGTIERREAPFTGSKGTIANASPRREASPRQMLRSKQSIQKDKAKSGKAILTKAFRMER